MKMRFPAACAVAGLLLAACSNGAKVATSRTTAPGAASSARLVALIQGAPAKTADEKSATVSGTVTAEVGGTTQSFSMTGGIDFAGKRTQFAMTIPDLGAIQTVVDNGVVYEEIPQLASMMGTKPWLKIDPTTLAQSGGPFASMMKSALQSESSDPSKQLDFLEGVTGTVTTVGAESVGGVSTTHYRFASSLDKVLQNLPASDQPGFQQVVTALGSSNAMVDVWIDGQGLVRQVSFALTPSPTATPSGDSTLGNISTHATIAFSNFGAPVTITVPPASQVTDFSQILSGLGGLSGLSPTP